MQFFNISTASCGRSGYEVEAITYDGLDRALVVRAEVEAGSPGDRWTPGEGPALGITSVTYRRDRDYKEFPIPRKAWPRAFGTQVVFAESSLMEAFEQYESDAFCDY